MTDSMLKFWRCL